MEETTAQLFAGGFAITILDFLVALCDQVTAVHYGNNTFAVCPALCREPEIGHTAKRAFAVCPHFSIWQKRLHTASKPFPVVINIQ